MNIERVIRTIARAMMTAGMYRVMRKLGTPAVIALAVVGTVIYAIK